MPQDPLWNESGPVPNQVLTEADYTTVMNGLLPLEQRQLAFNQRAAYFRHIDGADRPSTLTNMVAGWYRLGLVELQQLGLLPLSGQLECVGVVCAWSPSEPPWCQDFLCHPLGPGWLLDRLSFGQVLRQAAVQAGVTLLEPSRLISLQRTAGWLLGLSHGELACDFVVDASGRRGVVARRLGVRRHRYLAQQAVLGRLTGPPEDSDATLCVEALSPGWAYTCRVGTGRRVAAVLGSGRSQPARWWERLQASRLLRHRLQGYPPVSPVRTLPADSSLLEEFSGPARLADYGQSLRDRFHHLLAETT